MSLSTGISSLSTAVGAKIKEIITTLSGKQATLVSGTNIKTVNGTTLLGSGDLAVSASSVPWSGVTSKPTTLSGYGITDAATSTHNHTGIYQPLDSIYAVTKSLTLTTGWQDIGISGGDLSTGTWIVQIESVSDYTVGGGQYSEYYSGIMSWYSGSTNSSEADEIILHNAGHAPNGRAIFLRVLRHPSGILTLQIADDGNNSGSYSYSFKFRKII